MGALDRGSNRLTRRPATTHRPRRLSATGQPLSAKRAAEPRNRLGAISVSNPAPHISGGQYPIGRNET